MNPISYAIARIKQDIPDKVLRVTFANPINGDTAIPVSLDAKLREELIFGRVMPDCNIIGGVEITVPLSASIREEISPGVFVYRVPKVLTQNRSIMSVLSVAFANAGIAGSTAPYGQTNALMDASMKMANAMMSIPYQSDARCSLVGENIVMVEHPNMTVGNLYLRCIVENDSNMNNLNAKSWRNFAHLCILACKAEIYTRNIIQMDMAYLHAGQVLGAYKETVEGYSDASELYQDYLATTWQKVSIMNDPEMYDRLIRMTSGGLA